MNSKYIFISHSSKDWEKVRVIRNLIEEQGDFPLLFYLKCLDQEVIDESDFNELKSILSREIAVRNKFLLCESKNTRRGKSQFIDWEVDEVERINMETPGKIVVEKIDLDSTSIDESKIKIDTFLSKLHNVVVLSAMEDCRDCSIISNYLSGNGYNSWACSEDGEMRDSLSWNMGRLDWAIDQMLDVIGQRGILIAINSPFSDNNAFFEKSAYKIVRKGALVIQLNKNKTFQDNIIDISTDIENQLPFIKHRIEKIISQ